MDGFSLLAPEFPLLMPRAMGRGPAKLKVLLNKRDGVDICAQTHTKSFKFPVAPV